jgi:hypothetical protein
MDVREVMAQPIGLMADELGDIYDATSGRSKHARRSDS